MPSTIKTSSRPDGTSDFKQQRLYVWYPKITLKSAIPLGVSLSLVFIPLGVVLLIASRGIIEFQYDYTDCVSQETAGVLCSALREDQDTTAMAQPCTCSINITLEDSFEGNVYFYYSLQGFYQNHRRYAKSRDDSQLFGTHKTTTELNSDCLPYSWKNDASGVAVPIAPCGAIANSLFNDTFVLTESTSTVPIVRTGIAWPTDHSTKFNNPSSSDGTLTSAFSSYEKPFFWQDRVETLGDTTTDQGYKNEALIVWMRTAAFPNFRKPYGLLDRSSTTQYANGLPSGSYTITINYNYPAVSYGGRKKLVISTSSWVGKTKNDFLGIAYITVGFLILILSFIFCILQAQKQKLHSVHAQSGIDFDKKSHHSHHSKDF